MQLLEKLENLMGKVEALSHELTEVEQDLHQKESEALADIVHITKKGLTYQRLVQTKESHNCNGCSHQDRKTYFPEKGIEIARHEANEENTSAGTTNETSLYLLEDGTFIKVKKMGKWSRHPGDWNEWHSRILERNIDPLKDFEFDEIVRGFTYGLEERLENLLSRMKEQSKRLDKLKKFRYDYT